MDLRIFVLVASLCSPSGQSCEDKKIDDSETRPALNEISCVYSAGLWIADWVRTHPGYEDWRVMGHKCLRLKIGEQPVLTRTF
ncbi:MAG: hypothetical protein Athens041674_847 [Parcubacteria group bacterium Athens0416_74]|nr:MAG: hypothetical protein Athens041674_847 [Parcubacteria group bacterium Athens0416_74]